MLCGVVALGLETSGLVCLALVGIVVLCFFLVGLGWATTIALDFGGGFLVELVGAGLEVPTGG